MVRIILFKEHNTKRKIWKIIFTLEINDDNSRYAKNVGVEWNISFL